MSLQLALNVSNTALRREQECSRMLRVSQCCVWLVRCLSPDRRSIAEGPKDKRFTASRRQHVVSLLALQPHAVSGFSEREWQPGGQSVRWIAETKWSQNCKRPVSRHDLIVYLHRCSCPLLRGHSVTPTWFFWNIVTAPSGHLSSMHPAASARACIRNAGTNTKARLKSNGREPDPPL